MATRRKLSQMGYGAASVPAPVRSNSALPPPPDGSIPMRLPVSGEPQAPPSTEMSIGEHGDDSGDPMAALLRLLNEKQGQ